MSAGHAGAGILSSRLEYPFPSTEALDGIPIGNGEFGVLIGGGNQDIRLAVGRADFWVRGGERAGSEHPEHAARLPIGRVQVQCAGGWTPVSGGLYLSGGEAEIELAGRREPAKFRAVVLPDRPILCARISGLEGSSVTVRGVPAAGGEVDAARREAGLPAPEPFDLGEFAGWIQSRPGRPALCVAWLQVAAQGGSWIFLTAIYGGDAVDARRKALQGLEAARAAGYTPLALSAMQWWRKWWGEAARVHVPGSEADLAFTLGMHRLSCLTTPGSPPSGLCGPWLDDARRPALDGRQPADVRAWLLLAPALSGGHPGVLPHLLERCGRAEEKPAGGSPAGAGLAALMAFHAWQRSPAAGEDAVRLLRAVTAALQRYREAQAIQASYEFALIQALLQARQRLRQDGETGDDEALDGLRTLPPAAVDGVGDEREILVSDGEALTESCPNHSHLAGIYPFGIFDHYGSDTHRRLIQASLRRLTRAGTGEWTGESFPWAALLHARAGNGEAAATLLQQFRRFFVNDAHAPLMEARFPGPTIRTSRSGRLNLAGSGAAAAATLEMLVASAAGILQLFPACPRDWTEVRFEGVCLPGRIRVGATREGGKTVHAQIQCYADGPIRLVNPWGEQPLVLKRDGGRQAFLRGRALEVEAAAGETLEISAR